MEPCHSKGAYSFLRVNPYGSDIEKMIAGTEFKVKANGVFILMIVIK